MNRPATGDDGYTLVEVLVAVVILGVAFTSLLGAFGMSIIGSDIHKQQSQVEAVIDGAAENVKAATHVVCASPASYLSAAQSAATANPPAWPLSTVAITGVKYWDGAGFGTTCYDDAAHNNLSLQLITLVVTNPGTRAAQTISVVRR